MKIITILGARPQFVKASTISREIAKYDNIKEVIIHTGQHFDKNMSDIFFEEMKITKPHYNLNINGLFHGAMTGQMMEKLEKILVIEKPDWVLVYGDTNSTLAGALASSKLHIKVAHIEAGLRSFNMKMPEEINRILTDRISNILFCPTDSALQNLKNEGFEKFNCNIIKSGDVMQDSALFYSDLGIEPNIKINREFILCTIHRAENTDDKNRLKNIFEALEEIGKDIQIILPLHPRTKNIIQNSKFKIQNLTIIDPIGYLEMVYLIKNSKMIMTDSGGLQKEAFFFSKPCITLRDETEWLELVKNNYNILVGANKKKILDIYYNHKFNDNFSNDLYGHGNAANKIIETIINFKVIK